ncbi:MAG TPA: hypothetical protein VG733_07245 [Chthoniobacteraceae bacterium]|nr:hypothetical protein [Verrucomicrobiae bacterium]HWB59269.1 hypothetical protein [Chthoniobacteraceae bacterium]
MAEKSHPLVCKQCGYANEGERVYCHNCGTKLDRSLLPELNKPEEPLEQKRKRIKKIVNPKRGALAGSGKAFAYTLLSSIIVAALIVMMLPPDGVPPAINSEDLVDVSPSMNIEDALSANTPQTLQFKQEDINAFLQSKIKGSSNMFFGDSAKFTRVFIVLDDDQIRISTEESVFGKPIYCTVYYGLQISGGKLQPTVQGGAFGRLQIHPNLMKNLTGLFQKIWDTDELKRDKRLLDQCQSIQLHKGVVNITTAPAAQ